MAKKKIEVTVDGAELIKLSDQMAEEYRKIKAQIDKLESEITPAIEQAWGGKAGVAYIKELRQNIKSLQKYGDSLVTLLAALSICGKHYEATESNVIQHVAAI